MTRGLNSPVVFKASPTKPMAERVKGISLPRNLVHFLKVPFCFENLARISRMSENVCRKENANGALENHAKGGTGVQDNFAIILQLSVLPALCPGP